MGFGMMGMLLFWILVIFAIILVVRSTLGSGASPSQQPVKSALDILKERYARGEIEQEEFEQKKRDLGE